jgi:hypothetical protein
MGPHFHRKFLLAPGTVATTVAAEPRIGDLPVTTTAPAGL